MRSDRLLSCQSGSSMETSIPRSSQSNQALFVTTSVPWGIRDRQHD